MASRTLKGFIKEFPKFGNDITSAVVADWNEETGYVQGEAQRRAPVAGGFLIRSSVIRRAVWTNRGVESKIIFTVPYAQKLNDITEDINLKEKDELSYTVRGMQVFKRKKGELGFLDLAVKNASLKDRFINIMNKAINRAWRGL
jgi:hypothetical protein